MKKLISVLLIFLLTQQLFSCGYLLYPERYGKKGERIDPLVVALDALGLLFFIIPGVIAFAADINTGAIYIPDHKTPDTFPVVPTYPDNIDWPLPHPPERIYNNPDFNSGLQHKKNFAVINFNLAAAKKIQIEGEITKEKIAAILKEEEGIEVNLDDKQLQVYQVLVGKF